MKIKLRFASEVMRPIFLSAVLFSVCAPALLQAGSLWREAVTDERGMFASKTARRLGDLVRVSLDEEFIMSVTLALSDGRTPLTDSKGLASQFFNSLVTAAGNVKKASAHKFLPKNDAGEIRIPPSTTKLEGEGSYTRNFVANKGSISAQVIDVLPNGNLVIEGIRQVGVDKERMFVTLRGIIRPVDVGALETNLNVIPSSKVADARIDIVGEGALSSSQKKGWLMKLDDKITPY